MLRAKISYFEQTISKRFNRQLSILLACIFVILGLVSIEHVAEAQSDDLTVAITRPSEGETLYAGPTSLLYSTEISGCVKSREFNPTEIDIQMDVFQGDLLIRSQEAKALPEGTFSIFVTVNPDGSEELFGPDILYCANYCHFISEITLAPGPLLLRITVTNPDGQEAVAERNIIVDLSDYASIPVSVSSAESGEPAEAGIPISGSTWLYMWRSRIASGATDDQGKAIMRVEALSQAPTRYVFDVEPVIVGGVLYESLESVEVILEPGATTAGPIELTVTSKLGRIDGSLTGDTEQISEMVTVRAIHLPDGACHLTQASPQGAFVFDEMPLEPYLLALDNSELLPDGYTATSYELDLSEVTEATVQLPLELLEGNLIQGTIMAEHGTPLPFAWITADVLGCAHGVMPDSGAYTLHGLPDKTTSLSVSAPGYYSLAQVTDLSDGSLVGEEIVLAEQKATTKAPWGTGEIVIPPETTIDLHEHRFDVKRGWLWGKGGDNEPIYIRAGAAEILVDEGNFAMEYQPNERAWLYLFEGKATVNTLGSSDFQDVHTGQMVNLLNIDNLRAVPYEPVVVAVLRSECASPPVFPVWEPTIGAQIRNRLARVGIGTAQVVTFITYFLVVLSIVIAPVLIIYWHWRRGKTTA